MPIQYSTSNAVKDSGLSMTASENFKYSLFVQNSISPAFSEPTFPTLRSGLSLSP